MNDFKQSDFSIDEDNGPPPILLYGAIALLILVVGGIVGGIIIFREVLRPGQQERVMNMLPFMRAFQKVEPTPIGGILPTPLPNDNGDDPLSLLNIPIASSATIEATVEIVAPTATPQSSPTRLPTSTPTIVVTTEANTDAVVVSASDALPSSARMFGFRWQQQTWNNCGPANATIALSYYGWQESLEYSEDYLKPNREDKNVSPSEIEAFINERSGVRALARYGGDLTLLKTLIANEFPVIIETSAMFEAYDWIGHYRTPVAYDDVLGIFYIYDSFLGIGNGEGVTISYGDLDREWQDFNRVFIVLYPQERETELAQLLGNRYEWQSAAEHAFEIAQTEALEQPQDAFAWFNMGTSLNALGRYEEAARAFDQARRIGLPWRMLWYQFGPFEAYYHTGRYDDILLLAKSNLNNAVELEETYYWRGRAYEAQGDINSALESYRLALRYNPLYLAPRQALDALNS